MSRNWESRPFLLGSGKKNGVESLENVFKGGFLKWRKLVWKLKLWVHVREGRVGESSLEALEFLEIWDD